MTSVVQGQPVIGATTPVATHRARRRIATGFTLHGAVFKNRCEPCIRKYEEEYEESASDDDMWLEEVHLSHAKINMSITSRVLQCDSCVKRLKSVPIIPRATVSSVISKGENVTQFCLNLPKKARKQQRMRVSSGRKRTFALVLLIVTGTHQRS